jgi:hypothetical protein
MAAPAHKSLPSILLFLRPKVGVAWVARPRNSGNSVTLNAAVSIFPGGELDRHFATYRYRLTTDAGCRYIRSVLSISVTYLKQAFITDWQRTDRASVSRVHSSVDEAPEPSGD